MWLHMSGDLNYILSTYVFSSSFFAEILHGENEQSDVATYGGRIHVYIFSRVQLFG